MKTRDRILAAALELFNQKYERKVTTNHIASHLKISPGNLYYHFKNKQEIIYELFLQYEERIDTSLAVPTERKLTIEDKHNHESVSPINMNLIFVMYRIDNGWTYICHVFVHEASN